ncbi:MAG: molybdopterin synthase sulfur carrier subunit [Planctomycetota bacterium]|jgi:molybdopterin synthase sulfur carrier subunit
MIKILYFARLSETLNCKSEQLEWSADLNTTAALVGLLKNRGEPFSSSFSDDEQVLVAVNQTMAELSSGISDGDEVAFFPPVTGG